MSTKNHTEKILKMLEIQDRIVHASIFIDNHTKQGMNDHSSFAKNYLINISKINSYQRNTLTSDILTYWNESINVDTELFWIEMNQEQIDFKRKEPLRFALEKGRFYNVHQGMEAKRNWDRIKLLPSIGSRYSQTEINEIDRLIKEDEKKRYNVLQKCLEKKTIPLSQYLKFGESIAYFEECNLFETYFSNEQVDEIYAIWDLKI